MWAREVTMSLNVVSIPIGNVDDISLRAIQSLKSAEAIIAEERKPLFQFLKQLDIPRPEKIEYLNEHTSPEDLEPLVELCSKHNVVLVSDCGTPVFCDPGSQLIRACRSKNIPVTSTPGASSLMTLLSLSGEPLKEFYFRGFLPANGTRREPSNSSKMFHTGDSDGPPMNFRLANAMPEKHILLGLKLTEADEHILDIPIKKLRLDSLPDKAEFILMLYERRP